MSLTRSEYNYTEAEVRAVRDAAKAGGLEARVAECEQALALQLPLARVPAVQAVVEAWRATPKP